MRWSGLRWRRSGVGDTSVRVGCAWTATPTHGRCAVPDSQARERGRADVFGVSADSGGREADDAEDAQANPQKHDDALDHGRAGEAGAGWRRLVKRRRLRELGVAVEVVHDANVAVALFRDARAAPMLPIVSARSSRDPFDGVTGRHRRACRARVTWFRPRGWSVGWRVVKHANRRFCSER
jgi:hypothetical protein